MPQNHKYYLGEEIIIPNVPTFVCAEEKDRKHVLANLDELVVKAANESGGYGMLMGPELDERTSRRNSPAGSKPIHATTSRSRRCRCRGCRRSWTARSRDGTWICGRTSFMARDIFVLPGGLTRVALKEGSLVVNSSQGGGSKDTWVLADEPVAGDAAAHGRHTRTRRRAGTILMLARVADSIYWMSRYIERAENVARFIAVNLNLMLDLPRGSAQQWKPLVETTGDAAEFKKRSAKPRSRTSSSF